MTWENLQEDISEAFSDDRHVNERAWRSLAWHLEGFDVGDAAALAAEVARLERARAARWAEDRRVVAKTKRVRPARSYYSPELDLRCTNCGEALHLNKYSYTNKLFCSAPCRFREWSRTNRPPIMVRQMQPCAWCSAVFQPQKNARFCTKKCRNAEMWSRRKAA